MCGQWSIIFNNPGLNPSACGLIIPGLGFSSQGMQVDASGVFHAVWSSSTPVVQVDGTLTTNGLNATLRCLNTPATGSVSATPSGADYLGTATLSGVTVTIRVFKGPNPSS